MKVYNDLTRQKEELTPQEAGVYKVYVCGPTVYDLFHLGNARPFVVYDTLRRYLEYLGNKVIYVQNFTDVDDKMIRRANAEGISIGELADRMIKEYFTDADGLHIKHATVNPRATECIPEIIALIATLEKKGYTYILSDGVYFDTSRDPDYGKLSHRDLQEDEESAFETNDETHERVAHNQAKRARADFVLWKFKKEGEPSWPSPWGEGRPGWHIECSAMNKKYLGDTIDIHGGGQDLIFPHHENEIAQSEAANGKPFVRYWMHNGFVNVDNEKMAKSAGNFFRVRDLVQHYSYTVLRFFMLEAHYRMPINFSADLLEAARSGWERITTCAHNLQFLLGAADSGDQSRHAQVEELLKSAESAFRAGMDDDLNTADAIAAIFSLVREINSLVAAGVPCHSDLKALLEALQTYLGVLGLDPLEAEEYDIPEPVRELAARRTAARKAKQYSEADRLRAEIEAYGWRCEDTAQGSRLSPL